ncbi:MAG TPA: hypothetical protein VLM37_11455, partial [Fibrobacteraceae bacterium]|nr:hypothetical protein [Fibrobacteraceae bacterium]
ANRNQNTQKSLDRAINDGNKRLQAVDADIQKILNEVATVKANLQLQTLPDSLLSDSINGRIASADSAIALACIRKLQVKSHEFIVRPLFPVISESEPPNDIARAVIGALRQQQESQGKVENFFEQSIVENMMLVDLSHMRSRDIFRVAERFWMFPVLNDDDSYRVAIVTRFRLTDDQDQPIVFPDSVQSESPPEVSTEQESPPPPLSLEIEPTENTSIDDIDMNIENDPPNHLSWQRKVAIALWGVSIGGVAGGYYMNIKGDGYQDDFEQAKQNQNADELRASSDNLDKAEKYRNISYGTSIGTFVLGLIFWISGS